MISGKSSKIIKKGMLFILCTTEKERACVRDRERERKREGDVAHTWPIPNECIRTMREKKTQKTRKQSIDTNGHRRGRSG